MLQLWHAGYGAALIPIIPPDAPLSPSTKVHPSQCGKLPGKRLDDSTWVGFKDWTNHATTLADVEKWSDWGAGIGLRTRDLPFIDIDVSSEGVAPAIADAIEQQYGCKLLRRYGRAPRLAIPFRTDAPFRKVIFSLRDTANTECGKVEILGDGNQIVVAGIHPKTGAPYEWRDGDTIGGAEILAAHSPRSLPYLDAAQVPSLRETFAQAVAPFGLTVQDHGATNSVQDARTIDQSSLRAPSITALHEVVAAIPNGDMFDDRQKYIGMLYAIRAAAGGENYADGLEIAQDWAARWEGDNNPSDVARDYEACAPPSRNGWHMLLATAQRGGYNAAQWEFAAEHSATASELENAGVAAWAATASEVERIAALHGKPDRAFYLALSTVEKDGDVQGLFDSLARASVQRDPLADTFREVWKTARRLRSDANDASLFDFSLIAECSALASVTLDERRLLTKAAWSLLASPATLIGQLSATPGAFLRPGKEARAWLVEGWIPRPSVSAIIGAPGKGKSFAALELCGRIAKASDPASAALNPEQFAGRDVESGSVVYCASEDVDGWRERAARWEAENGQAPNLRILGSVPPLSRLGDALQYMRHVAERLQSEGLPPLRAVVIDVFRSAFTGKENDSDDVGAAMATAHAIARMLRVTVILVHHTPRDDDRRPRGSNAFEASLDFMAAVTKPEYGDVITWTVSRNKSGPAGDRAAWKLDANGVLKPHATPSNVADVALTATERCAEAVAEAVCALARPRQPVTRAALKDDLPRRAPALFGTQADVVNPIRTRMTRALNKAKEAGWIVDAGEDLYAIGPVARSTPAAFDLSTPPESLDDLAA